MADAHSTRREQAGSARREAREAGGSKRLRSTQIAGELEQMALTLTVVYSTCVVAELALQGQKADRDMDVLATLRHHVSRPVSREIERLSALAAELRKSLPPF